MQFQELYRAWCTRSGARPRFGAVGKHGSIALIERFFRSLKQECTRRIVVPLALPAMEAEVDAYLLWYNERRPHQALRGATPAERLAGTVAASDRPMLEPRARYPLARGDPAPARRRVRGRLEIVVTHLSQRRHLPIVTLRDAA